MSYGDKVLSKLDVPGLLLMVLGAALVYGSGRLAEKLFPAHRAGVDLAFKAAGLVLAIIGGLILLDLIG